MIEKGPIAYHWALDSAGYPQPITLARRGRRYFCPLCRGAMIARLGRTLQHHFAHEQERGCTSAAVTRAALARWITIQARQALAEKQAIDLSWACKHCGNTHRSNLLQDIGEVVEGYTLLSHFADVALLNTTKDTPDPALCACSVIFVQDAELPTEETLHYFMAIGLFTLTIPATVLPAEVGFGSLMAQARVASGPCPILQNLPNLIRDPEAIKRSLSESVIGRPGYFYGQLETVQGLSDLVKVGQVYVWLPPDRWQQVIGGMRNPLAPDVNVTIQNWTQPDGRQIWVFLVEVRNTYAVGVRWYRPGVMPIVHIEQNTDRRQVTALEVARHLVSE